MSVATGDVLSYRRATSEDVNWLVDAYIASLGTAIAEARGYWDETKERGQFLEQLRLSETSVVVSRKTAVGFYTVWFEADHAFLRTLCIVPESQNRRFGTLTMCEIAQRAGNLPVHLSVLKSNRRARRFYEQLGCIVTSSSEYHDHLVWPNKAMHATCAGARP
jgi:ribosomal protein S18 acetylase RimI-like enzyme